MGRNGPCKLASTSTKAHDDRCALLVGLEICKHDPQRDVGHVRPEAVVPVVLRRPAGWDAVVEAAASVRERWHLHVAEQREERSQEDVRVRLGDALENRGSFEVRPRVRQGAAVHQHVVLHQVLVLRSLVNSGFGGSACNHCSATKSK